MWRDFLECRIAAKQLKPKANNVLNFLPIRLCFINVYTYPNPKPTPYNNAKTVIIVVQCDKNDQCWGVSSYM